MYVVIKLLVKLNLFVATTQTGDIEPGNWRSNMEATFLPMVKPDLKQEFLKVWSDWFVLANVIEQTKKPGLLKGIFVWVIFV